jgi:ribosomal protein L7/L12
MNDIYIAMGLGAVLVLALLWYLWMRARARDEHSLLEHQHTTSHEQLGEVDRLLRQGDKGAAMQRYQTSTGASSTEAKQVVDALDMGMPTSAFDSAFSSTDTQLELDVRRLLIENRKISAIKLYSDKTGVGLKEAKEAVEEMQREIPASASFSPSDIARVREIETEIRRLLAEGKKISAIKLYREQTGVGLKEAKEAVERLQR